MSNIIEVYPLAGKTARTTPAWQYDYGQILHVNGLELPASYKAEFSNTGRGDAISTVQTTAEILIPAHFLTSGSPVYIWLVVVDEQSRTTEYALIVAQADYADAVKALSIAHNRAGWAVTLERWDGAQLARKSFGAFPDMTPPAPEPEPEPEESEA